MTPVSVFLSVLFFTLLGMAYVKGYDAVKRRSPENLVQFYLIMATIRMVLVATVVALYVVFSTDRDKAIEFAAMFIIMYARMMVVTLVMRH
jgi:cytochrome c biogenesis factor